jgi:hypothetical protein
MTKFITKILAPLVALVAAIMGLIDIISAINRVKTGLEVIVFISNTTQSAIKSYNDFATWRDGFYDFIFQSIFGYFPFLHEVPGVVWDTIRAVIFLYVAYLCIKIYSES